MQYYPRSKAAWLILALGVLLLLLPQLVNGFVAVIEQPTKPRNKYKNRPNQGLTANQKVEMMPSRRNELTTLQRIELFDKCGAIGSHCTFAEQCCTTLCLKFTKKCVL